MDLIQNGYFMLLAASIECVKKNVSVFLENMPRHVNGLRLHEQMSALLDVAFMVQAIRDELGNLKSYIH